MRAGVRDPRSHRRACLARIAAAENLDDVRRFLLFNCVATYLELDGRAEEEFAILLAGHGESEGRTMMTWEEKIEARGMREVLLSLLQQRFEPLPAAAAQKVATMTSAKELRRLADRLLSARSLEELGLA